MTVAAAAAGPLDHAVDGLAGAGPVTAVVAPFDAPGGVQEVLWALQSGAWSVALLCCLFHLLPCYGWSPTELSVGRGDGPRVRVLWKHIAFLFVLGPLLKKCELISRPSHPTHPSHPTRRRASGALIARFVPERDPQRLLLWLGAGACMSPSKGAATQNLIDLGAAMRPGDMALFSVDCTRAPTVALW